MEVCSIKELESFVAKEFIKLITCDELSYRGLNPVEYEKQVGENSKFGNYVILTEEHAKYCIETYYPDTYEDKLINDFVYDCTTAKTLEILNKTLK